MPSLVFYNGTVILDNGVIPDGMVLAIDGRIEYVGVRRDGLIPQDAVRVDAAGQYISPGFVDLHIHGGAGSDFMDATRDDVETVFRFHASHGTTAMCPTTATAPLDDILSALDAVLEYSIAGEAWGRMLGVHIEGPYLATTKRGCHLEEHLRLPSDHEWRQLLERVPIASMTLAPELSGARDLIHELRHRGAIASIGHSEALYHEVAEAIAWGANHVTHLYCAMTDSLRNRWAGTPNPRTAGIVEAVFLEDRLSSEIIPDGKHLSRETMKVAFRAKGYEKLALVTDAMRGAGMPDGEYTFGPKTGTRAIVRNRESRLPDGTALASSVFAMDEMVQTFRQLVVCPIWQAVRMASLTPAVIAGRSAEIGSLAPGKWADIILFDDEVKVKAVYLGGRKLNIAVPSPVQPAAA